MPEGPEVRRITDRLSADITGRILTNIRLLNPSYGTKQVRGPAVSDLMETLTQQGLEVNEINCKGKFIYWRVGEFEIWNTLGMSGTWRNYVPKNHAMVAFEFSDGSCWYYRDSRRFGTFRIFRASDGELQRKLDSLGPDMLSDPPTASQFIDRLRRKSHWNITKALMDQSVVSGIGNYIKAEVLYRARISPWVSVSDLSDAQLTEIYEATCWVIKASYESRGVTLRDYVMPDGSTGDYQFQFLCYSQPTDPLGNPIKKETTPDGRTTWWCPEIQSASEKSVVQTTLM